jgi:hypothetical protein
MKNSTQLIIAITIIVVIITILGCWGAVLSAVSQFVGFVLLLIAIVFIHYCGSKFLEKRIKK